MLSRKTDRSVLVCIALGTLTFGVSVPAVEVTLAPVADTALFEAFPNFNLGQVTTLPLGATANTRARARCLLKFDPRAAIPPNVLIERVRLDFTVTRLSLLASNPIPLQLHRALQNWGEGAQSAQNNGATAAAGEATWAARFHPNTNWSMGGGQPGTDFVAEPSGVVMVGDVNGYTVESTPALVDDVQRWLDLPRTNFGWMFLSGREDIEGAARRIAAREAGEAAPRLIVEYSTELRILRAERTAGGFCLAFRAAANTAYFVESRARIDAGPWTHLTNVAPQEASHTAVVCDGGVTGSRFYRVSRNQSP